MSVTCNMCNGVGETVKARGPCFRCGGAGQLWGEDAMNQPAKIKSLCVPCNASGQLRTLDGRLFVTCPECDGTGRELKHV